MKEKFHYAWKILFVCCCLSGAVSGMVIHCRGIFFAPAAASLGVAPTTYATYQTWGGLMGVVVMPWITKIFNRYPIKRILIVYFTIFCGSVIGLGLAKTMWQCCVIGAVQGTVSAFLTLYPISTVLKNWFTQRRGFAIGFANMFAGFVASIMNLVLERAIALVGWRSTYLLVGCAAFAIGVIPTALFLVRSPADIGLEPYGGHPPETPKSLPAGKPAVRWRDRRMLLTFLPMIFITVTTYFCGGQGQHMSNYAIEAGFSAAAGATLVSISMLGNVGGKLLGGLLNDWIGIWRTSVMILCSMAVGASLFLWGRDSIWLLRLAALLCGQATAFIVVEIPLLLGELYQDSATYDRCFSVVIRCGSLASALNSTVINLLHTCSGSYAVGFTLCAALLLCAAVLVVFLRRSVSPLRT